MTDEIQAVAQRGAAALAAGHFAEARAAFEQVEAAGRATPRLLLMLAQCCARGHDAAGEERALARVLALDPRNLAALSIRGDRAAENGDDRAASSWYGAVLSAAANGATPDAARLVPRARERLAAARQRFEAHLTRALAATDAGERFAEAREILAGRAEPQLQAPTSFYYPGLPQTAFFARADFAWVDALKAAARATRAELDAVLADRSGFRPYVEADPTRPNKPHVLLDRAEWSAFHLFERGAPTPESARCPATMAALAQVPLPSIADRSPMALFSLLAPRTHIPPHHGMLNTRVIVHLPLIVPPNCRLRVGNHERPVEAGRVMIFDDSILHEAWNDSDDTRVVLLFEVWRPELSIAERDALTQMFEAIRSYGAQ